MIRALQMALLVAAAAALLATTETAQAANGCGGCGYGDGYYYGFYRRNLQTDQLPPYFSQFPPVYYSDIIPRPYGWSPFALRPHEFNTLPEVAPKPVMIKNPYVDGKANPEAEAEDDRTAATSPRVILNPYVDVAPVQVVKHAKQR